MQYRGVIQSPVGPLEIVTSETHLLAIRFVREITGPNWPKSTPPVFQQTVQQLQEYFAGQRFQFTLPLHLPGTPFQRDVWAALQTIPYGSTISYQELAQRAGHPRAVRAVGNANGKNPIPIVVPCHRVIRANGSLGGYASGTAIKTRLLQLEQQFRSALQQK